MTRTTANIGSVDGKPLAVTYVTQWFPPEPVQMPLWIAQALRRQGIEVTVLTGIPNFPSGKVQDGYHAWRPVRDVIDGFNVVRAPLFPSHDHSVLGRVANYSSYAVASTLLGAAHLRASDVALVYSSPATSALAPMVSRTLTGTPYVLLIQDLWPDSVFATGFLTAGAARRIAEKTLTRFTNRTYCGAAHIAVTSPGMRELLVNRGVPAEKVSVIYNWADEAVFRPSPPDATLREQLGIGGEFLILYAGNHGAAQALDVPIAAMADLRDLPIHLALVGDGIDKPSLRARVEAEKLTNVHFLDPVAPERVPGLMSAADLQLVSLVDRELFQITLPSKIQGILASGQPLLVCAPGDAARVVVDSGAGFSATVGDSSELANVIRHASEMTRPELKALGTAGQDYYAATLSEAINAKALATVLRAAAKTRRGAARG